MRPPNIITAAADILAGCAVAVYAETWRMLVLVISGMALYAGGVVFNDYFDRRLDASERPERPIPSGRVPAHHAAAMGSALLVAGVILAVSVSIPGGVLALAIAGCALIYDSWAKHRNSGVMFMGLCRGLNLLLGVSAVPAILRQRWFLAWIPFVYIVAITILSKDEVKGGSRKNVLVASGLLVAVFGSIVLLYWIVPFEVWWAAFALVILGFRIVPNLRRAYQNPDPIRIRMAVRSGVLSLVVLDCAIAAGFAGPWFGLMVLALLVPSGILARYFAVT